MGRERLKRGFRGAQRAVPLPRPTHSCRHGQKGQADGDSGDRDGTRISARRDRGDGQRRKRRLGRGRACTDASGVTPGWCGRCGTRPERTWGHRRFCPGHRPATSPPALARRRAGRRRGRPSCPRGTRVFSAGQGRKTDVTHAHAVALAATRMTGLRPPSLSLSTCVRHPPLRISDFPEGGDGETPEMTSKVTRLARAARDGRSWSGG